MSTELELLRAFFAHARPRPATAPRQLPPAELRFALEYASPPDRAAEVKRISKLLETDNFELRPLFDDADADLARFLVLAAPGVERPILHEQLFALAHTLRERLALVSVEPDVGSAVYADPEPPRAGVRREAADVMGALCLADATHPPGEHWALDNVRAPAAWTISPNKGLGIVIAQPDTGVAKHDELEPGALRLDLAKDILDGGADPEDPLDPTTANPGHGTGTASVAVSREAGRIVGVAPRASLVPIRCISDAKVFDAAPIAAAVDHARKIGAHVVTMSLGGVPGRALHAAITKAVDGGIIVLAAAGNCVRVVVWPARYNVAIAVAGSNVLDEPWRGTSRGDDVDITAPAELVWRAERAKPADPVDGVKPGQGTSFAVAIVAGTAALWLSHHGREQVLAEAAKRGVTVQALFRRALRTTARRPPDWDTGDFGAGIVDAGALLGLPLADIPAVAPESIGLARDDGIASLLAEVSTVPGTPASTDIDLTTYGLEIASLLLEDARMGVGPRSALPEARSTVGASPQLRREAAKATDPRLRRFAHRSTLPPTGVLRRESPPPAEGLGIVVRDGGGLESAAPLTIEAARALLTPERIKKRLDHAEKVLASVARDDDPDDATEMRRQILTDGEQVLRHVADPNAGRPLEPRERLAYEAMVFLHGRPALRVERRQYPAGPPGGPVGWYESIDLNAPEISDWKTLIEMASESVKPVLAAVGRIDREGEHIGTGFVVDGGLVMTNRHVLEAIATPVPRRANPEKWILNSPEVTINFSPEADDASASFRIKAVVYAGADPIEDVVDFRHLDLALLEVETANAAGTALPAACALSDRDIRERKGCQLFAVGYPARPVVPATDFDGVKRSEVVEQLGKIFNLRFGRKYFSPGLVHQPVGQDATDTQRWVFGHDATTLGGNSGSPIFFFGDGLEIIGLHFAGDWMRSNHAHSLLTVKSRVPRMATFRWR